MGRVSSMLHVGRVVRRQLACQTGLSLRRERCEVGRDEQVGLAVERVVAKEGRVVLTVL